MSPRRRLADRQSLPPQLCPRGRSYTSLRARDERRRQGAQTEQILMGRSKRRGGGEGGQTPAEFRGIQTDTFTYLSRPSRPPWGFRGGLTKVTPPDPPVSEKHNTILLRLQIPDYAARFDSSRFHSSLTICKPYRLILSSIDT